MKKNILFAVILLAVLGTAYFFYARQADAPASTANAAPEYVRASEDDIVVALPESGEVVGSVIDVSGRARGYWYFEASFPLEIVDENGTVIAAGIATAQDEWMTEEFVPFTATLTLTAPYTGSATLILHKDNPSGEESRNASVSIPIVVQ